MSAFVKLIDKRHLVMVGLEGFYGPNDPKRLMVNPEDWASRLGSDFIRNSLISSIDFISVHIYPDHWSGGGCLVWQFLVGGMQEFSDDFGIILREKTPILSPFIEQSCRLTKTSSVEYGSVFITNGVVG
ncbi:Mannan endo-1,4-beta-mannosidase [Vigna angularis]|uniref:Mannan endo-1,4-beta-mannosidase n=1 Tax=Phaseolus angularis TaxID=3914 RepID=A0A8T0KGD0_PHAAN|nr:Mannan endo-1,4-beta-mannosidase [Vigna angularis]